MIYCDSGGRVDTHRPSVHVREGAAALRDGGEHVRLHRVEPQGPEEPGCVGSSRVDACAHSRPRCSAIQHQGACATAPRQAGYNQREPGQITAGGGVCCCAASNRVGSEGAGTRQQSPPSMRNGLRGHGRGAGGGESALGHARRPRGHGCAARHPKGAQGGAALRGALRQCARECGPGRHKARAAGAFLVKWEVLLGPANARGGVWRAQEAVMSAGSIWGVTHLMSSPPALHP